MKKIITIACLSALLAACSSTPETQSGAPVDERSVGAGAVPGGPGSSTNPASGSSLSGSAIPPGGTGATTGSQSQSQSQSDPRGRTPLTDPNSILSKRSVFYDYDSFVVKDEYRPLIEAHGRYLRDNRGARIIVQGNTDDRGGREYNLALGNKRAESVKRALGILGVSEQQVETVSFGKEKPRNPGSNEAAWAENRRSDIIYSGE
ncbi:MAG: peptidoglycan-associated lipoprotein Pal [Casimicrobiaceae bacterium]